MPPALQSGLAGLCGRRSSRRGFNRRPASRCRGARACATVPCVHPVSRAS